MRRLSQLLLILSTLFAPLPLPGQEIHEMPSGAQTLARLAYDTSAATQRGDLRHLCFSLSRDGEYQIIRATNDKPTQYLRGKMSKDQLQKLKDLLDSKELRSQSGTAGGLILQDSESFRIEMPIQLKKRSDGTYILPERDAWRLQWLNADNSTPFPDSIAKVVHWLRRFDPKDGEEFSYTEFSQVCPSGGLRLVQPSIADNQSH